jgi:hypothetical protein
MDRAGISRVVAMRRSGHKTESVYNRYNIVDDRDLQDAAKKLETYMNSATGKVTGEVADFDQKKSESVNG